MMATRKGKIKPGIKQVPLSEAQRKMKRQWIRDLRAELDAQDNKEDK